MQKEDVEKNAIVVWQDVEQAILLRRWNGCVEIKQGTGFVLIEEENAKEFLKLLKETFERKAKTD